jgi:hypothetical protein
MILRPNYIQYGWKTHARNWPLSIGTEGYMWINEEAQS